MNTVPGMIVENKKNGMRYLVLNIAKNTNNTPSCADTVIYARDDVAADAGIWFARDKTEFEEKFTEVS